MALDPVRVYLVGKTTCPFTVMADRALRSAPDVDKKVQRVMCDLSPPTPLADPQSTLCSTIRGYPKLVACSSGQCSLLLDGFMPYYESSNYDDPTTLPYARVATQEIIQYISSLS